MDVLLVDNSQYSPTTPLFADCLSRGDVFFDEAPYLEPLDWSLAQKAAVRVFGRPLTAGKLNRDLLRLAVKHMPDVLLIVKGLYIRPETLRSIKRETGATLVNFATDDPWNRKASSSDLLSAISCYDLYACPRKAMIPDVLRAGCPRAEFVMFGYKPGLHYPSPIPMPAMYDVAFIGGADRDRLSYARSLAREASRSGSEFTTINPIGQPGLSFFGGYWSHHSEFFLYARGIVTGRAFTAALWSHKIAVCLTRKTNRDDHKMLTFEAPACGAFTLLEDTSTHRDLFGALQQNIFFRTPEDLANQVRFWLAHPAQRERAADAQRDTIRSSGHTWQDRFHQILVMVEEILGGASKGTGDAVVV